MSLTFLHYYSTFNNRFQSTFLPVVPVKHNFIHRFMTDFHFLPITFLYTRQKGTLYFCAEMFKIASSFISWALFPFFLRLLKSVAGCIFTS